MGMSPRLLRPRKTTHPEAAAWRAAVVANGGSVSGTTLSAVNKFCKAIDAAGIRDRFYRLNLFCGDQLAAALVPLYRGPVFGGTTYGATADVNTGAGVFVSGDYTLSTGLTGNGSSKHLRTDIRLDQLPSGVETDIHLATYIRTTPTSNATISSYSFHSTDSAARQRYEITPNLGTLGRELGQNGPASPTYPAMTLVSRSSATSLFTYRNDVAGAELTNSVAAVATGIPITVFARNLVTGTPPAAGSYAPTFYFSGALGAYSIGRHLTAARVASFANAMTAFQTALGRA